jgi:hypothetical protein
MDIREDGWNAESALEKGIVANSKSQHRTISKQTQERQ